VVGLSSRVAASTVKCPSRCGWCQTVVRGDAFIQQDEAQTLPINLVWAPDRVGQFHPGGVDMGFYFPLDRGEIAAARLYTISQLVPGFSALDR